MKNNIQKILKDRNLSVSWLQNKSKISRSTLDPLIKSDKIPEKTKIETLNRVANALDISFYELLGLNNKISDTLNHNFKINLIEHDKKIDALYNELKIIDVLILEARFSENEACYFLVNVSYEFEHYFVKENKKLMRELYNIHNSFYTYKGIDEKKEKEIREKEKEKYMEIFENVQKYDGKKIFHKDSFLINDIKPNLVYEPLNDDSHYAVYQSNISFEDLIFKDEFLDKTVDFLVDLYDIKNNFLLSEMNSNSRKNSIEFYFSYSNVNNKTDKIVIRYYSF